jgi:hypothetical protein
VTGRSAAVQGGLAALGLVAAYLTWTREPERGPGEAVVIDASKADVARVRYEDEENILGLERRSEGGETVIGLHLEEKSKQVLPAKKGDPMPPPTPPSTPPRDVLGNADAVKLADRFAPLVSPRAFGILEKKKLAELGLDEPKRSLEVVVRGDVRKYDIGIAMNAQNGEAFLRDKRDGRVYLMPRGLLADMQNNKRLLDARLHVFDSKEFDRIVISAGGKRKEYLHEGRENFSTEGYAPVKTPGKRDQTVKNWHDAIWRTFPMEVLGRGEVPKKGTLKTAFRIEYFERGKSVGWLEMARLEGGEQVSGATPDNIFARSEHTVGWTRLHSGDQLVADGEKIVAAP